MNTLRKALSIIFSTCIFAVMMSATAFAADASAPQSSGMGSMVLSIVLMIAIFYFLLIRPQKKKEKEAKNMRDSLMVGDELVTIGGIVGKVIKIKDDEVTIETGSNKTRLTFKKWGINQVLTEKDIAAATASKKVDDDPDSYLDEYVDEIENKK